MEHPEPANENPPPPEKSPPGTPVGKDGLIREPQGVSKKGEPEGNQGSSRHGGRPPG